MKKKTFTMSSNKHNKKYEKLLNIFQGFSQNSTIKLTSTNVGAMSFFKEKKVHYL